MNTIIIRVLVILFLSFLSSITAEFSEFEQSVLKDSQSIRAISMGNAYTALGEGVGTLFYNPAGLAQGGVIYGFQDLDNKNEQYENNSLRYIYRAPFAFSQQQVKNLDGDTADITSFGFGRKGSRGVDWGVTYKSIQTKVNNVSTAGSSADLGIIIHLLRNMNIGVMLQDGYTNNIDIPSTFKTGIALFSQKKELLFTTDLVYKTIDGETSYTLNSGMEYHLSDGLVVRGGYFDRSITAGVNFIFPFFEIEYGVVSSQENSNQNRHLLGFRIGRGLATYKNRRRYTMFKPDSYAEFTLAGNLVEGKSEASLLGGHKIGSNDLLSMINQSIEDDTCKGYIINIKSLSSSITSVALIQEIRNSLLKAKAKGKHVYIYLDGWASLPEYYLASIGDTIVMPELGSLSHLGLKLEITKANHFFDNFGLKEEVVAAGEHKGDWHAQSGPLTSRQKYHTQDVLDQLYSMVITEIKEQRTISDNVFETVFDGRFITATEAKELGLVDKLGYYDDFIKSIERQAPDTRLDRALLSEFVSDYSSPLIGLNVIPVIEIDGVIRSGRSGSGFFFGGKTTGAEDVEDQVQAILDTPFIRGVVLRVNSPGGSMLAADRMYKAINKLQKANKLVYTSFGNMAASGGYYVAMNTHKIVANETTLTGSIGVISSYLSYKGLQDTLGIEHESFTTGKYMELLSPNKSMTDDELFLLTQHQDKYYEIFVKNVQHSRHLTTDEVYDIAQGQVFTGKDALRLKIVDDIGSFQDTVNALAKDLNISHPNVVVMRSESNDFFSLDNISMSVTVSMLKQFIKTPLKSIF